MAFRLILEAHDSLSDSCFILIIFVYFIMFFLKMHYEHSTVLGNGGKEKYLMQSRQAPTSG